MDMCFVASTVESLWHASWLHIIGDQSHAHMHLRVYVHMQVIASCIMAPCLQVNIRYSISHLKAWCHDVPVANNSLRSSSYTSWMCFVASSSSVESMWHGDLYLVHARSTGQHATMIAIRLHALACIICAPGIANISHLKAW